MENGLRILDHPLLEIERGNQFTFYYNEKPVSAYAGETIAAALHAAGLRIFSRSFKYHRPRGIFCLSGHCSHCLMRVDGVPNVRTCVEPARAGMYVESQNAWPSLKFDLAALSGSLDFLVRPGFQYRCFIRNRSLYHLWEKFLRRMAGIGSLPDTANRSPVRRIQAEPEVVIVGGGAAGLSAALHAAQTGSQVWLIEKESTLGGRLRYDTTEYELPERASTQHGFLTARNLSEEVERLENCRVIKEATAFAWYDEGILAVIRPGEFWELRPRRVVVATGSYESPMLFENNDLPGIFLAGGIQRLMHRDFMRPGKRAVVVTDRDDGYALARQMLAVDVKVAAVLDNRNEELALSGAEARKLKETGIPVYTEHEIKAAVGRRSIKGVIFRPLNSSRRPKTIHENKLACDTLCIAGARSPANELLFQRTCEGAYILESPHQYTRKPVIASHMQVDADVYVAGAAGGSQRVEQSMLEGKIAGLSAALDLGYGNEETTAARDGAEALLNGENYRR